MERIAVLRQQLGALVKRLDRRQRLAALVVGVLTLGSLLAIVLMASDSPYRVLFSDLPPEELTRVVEVLEEADIPHRLEGDTTLSVPLELLHDARLRVASQGLPQGEGVGMELFDDNDFGMTHFTQRVNYQRAMEAELARTIRHLDGVRGARVHLVLPEEALFRADQEEASASVVLTTDGTMPPDAGAIQSVRYLVASAVEGLRPGQVTIVDQSGRMLARASDGSSLVDAGEALQVGSALETDMSTRILTLLSPVVGQENVRASVRLEIDTSEVVETTETYDPATTVVRNEERTEEVELRGDNVSQGVPGAAANLPGGPGATVDGVTSSATRNSERVNYEINGSVRQRTQSGFQVLRLTAAVLIDESAFLGEAVGSGDATPALTEARLANLTELVKDAVGYDPARGDRVTVSLASFVPTSFEAPADDPVWRDPGFMVPALRYTVLFALTVLLGFFVIRPAVRALARAKGEDEQDVELIVRTVSELDGHGPSVSKTEERTNDALPPRIREQERLRREIIDLSRGDLDRASQVISQWIRMGGREGGETERRDR